jgi:hypothetical protein
VHELLSAMTDAGQSPGAYGEYVVLVWKGSLHSCKIGEGRPSSHAPIPSVTLTSQRATQWESGQSRVVTVSNLRRQ